MAESDEVLERQKIRDLKAACVPIGISIDENPLPHSLGGTGFIVDSEGYVLTATHVIDGLVSLRQELKRQGKKASICAYYLGIKDNHAVIHARGLVERRRIEITPTEKFPAPAKYDAILCRMIGKKKYPFLEIKKPGKLELNQKIRICGYPGGKGTFNFDDFESGIRMSPLVQTGRISGVMPIDDSVMPTGLITDIYGTGGSSGSPIVDSRDNQVIGIAQRVLQTNVLSLFKQDLIGTAHIGLIFGISNYGLAGPIQFLLKQMKEELDENGKLKPEFEKKYQKSDTTDVMMHIKKPEDVFESKKEE